MEDKNTPSIPDNIIEDYIELKKTREHLQMLTDNYSHYVRIGMFTKSLLGKELHDLKLSASVLSKLKQSLLVILQEEIDELKTKIDKNFYEIIKNP